MNTPIDEFGINAGKIWETITHNGSLMTQTKLQKMTKLSDEAFFSAIGWLARENKINKTGIVYRLGETNLTQKIGSNAGKIWNMLSKQKEADLSSIAKRINGDVQDVHSALGWLARENKIDTIRGKNHQIFIRLK
ncbi:MAG: winged helix-turn-helix domain-containing protein [Candidatus Thermoplasmatota archaeon]|nr:winged helix-turn-helix domain-containing protein [Candidatus Thermoplasmatota archaeon]